MIKRYYYTLILSILFTFMHYDIRWIFSYLSKTKHEKTEGENGTVLHESESPLSTLNDQHCLLSGRYIETVQQSIRCGRCCGTFCLNALQEMSSSPSSALSEHPLLPYLIPTTKEHLEPQSHEEWFCPYCLQEDTNSHSHSYVPSCLLSHVLCCVVLCCDVLSSVAVLKTCCTAFEYCKVTHT